MSANARARTSAASATTGAVAIGDSSQGRSAEFVCNSPDGDEVFDDALLGRQTQTPAEQCGDLLVRDRDGHWTYQFAVTVDDVRQGVTLVIRGAGSRVVHRASDSAGADAGTQKCSGFPPSSAHP